jgi:hypothetical protein
MKRWALLAAVAAALVAAAGIGAAQPGAAGPISVRVVGLCVTADTGSDMMMRPFNEEPGTSLALLIESKDKTIVQLNDEESRLASIKDDKGKDLSAGGRAPGMFTMQSFGSQVSEDGRAALYTVHGPQVPGGGASLVKAEGAVALTLGTQKATERQKAVALRAGSKITVGPVPMDIVEVGTDGQWGKAMSLQLRARQDMAAICAIKFYDGAGKEVESQVFSTMTMGGLGSVTVTKEIGLDTKLTAADVEVEYWKGLEKASVPFAVQAGIALK